MRQRPPWLRMVDGGAAAPPTQRARPDRAAPSAARPSGPPAEAPGIRSPLRPESQRRLRKPAPNRPLPPADVPAAPGWERSWTGAPWVRWMPAVLASMVLSTFLLWNLAGLLKHRSGGALFAWRPTTIYVPESKAQASGPPAHAPAVSFSAMRQPVKPSPAPAAERPEPEAASEARGASTERGSSVEEDVLRYLPLLLAGPGEAAPPPPATPAPELEPSIRSAPPEPEKAGEGNGPDGERTRVAIIDPEDLNAIRRMALREAQAATAQALTSMDRELPVAVSQEVMAELRRVMRMPDLVPAGTDLAKVGAASEGAVAVPDVRSAPPPIVFTGPDGVRRMIYFEDGDVRQVRVRVVAAAAPPRPPA